MSNSDNFRIWFSDFIRSLATDRNAGFLIVMVSFPLLERYLRQLTKAEPKSPYFTAGLLKVLPELQTLGTAQVFWNVYRHGLLHNVTLSRESHGLTHDSKIVDVQTNGKVWLNPVLFSERVLTLIETDFATFELGNPLPAVGIYGRVPDPPGTPNYYLGTAMPPAQGGKP